MPSLRELMSGGVERVQDLQLENIEKSEQNFYELKGIDDFKQKVNALKKSIMEQGQLEPILVIKKDSNYEIVSGHTRFEAISELNEEGLHDETIKAIVLESDFDEFQKMGLIVESNLQREKNLGQIDIEIKYYGKLFDILRESGRVSGRKDDFIAERMGKTGRTIRNYRQRINGDTQEEDSNSHEREYTISDVKKNLKKVYNALKKTQELCEMIGGLDEMLDDLDGASETIQGLIYDCGQ